MSLLVCAKVNAQDLIVLNNDALDEYQVKVLEVTNDVVKYKKWSYQDGPTFTLKTSAILYVQYQNGEKQTFTQAKGKDKNKQKSSTDEGKKKISLNFKKSKKQTEAVEVAEVKEEIEEPVATSTAPAVEKVADNNIQPTPVAESAPKLNIPEETKSETSHETSWVVTKKGTVKGGANILCYAIPSGEYDSSFFLGQNYYIGYNVIDNLFIRSGIGYLTGWVEAYGVTNNTTYLPIPIQIGYSLPLGNICALNIQTGPKLNYAIAGKIEQGQQEIKYKDLDGIKRFSAQYTIGATFLIKGWGISAEYGFGLGDNGGDMFVIGLAVGM